MEVTIINTLINQIVTDQEDTVLNSEDMLETYNTASPETQLAINKFCLALCGWTFVTIIEMTEKEKKEEKINKDLFTMSLFI